MVWAGLMNGDLLRLAEKQFDVFITTDRNLSVQQNLTNFNIAVVVLCALTNRLADLKPLVQDILATLLMVKRTRGNHRHITPCIIFALLQKVALHYRDIFI